MLCYWHEIYGAERIHDLKSTSLLPLQMSMNVSSEMVAVIKTVSISMEVKDVVVRLDTDLKVMGKHAEVCSQILMY